MVLGKCYHSNGDEMTNDFKVDFLPELSEMLNVENNLQDNMIKPIENNNQI